MAESTLSVTINSLRRDIGHSYCGFPGTISEWSAQEFTDFDFILKRGLRLFYFPPASDTQPPYEWSFLRKNGTVTLNTNDSDYNLPDDFSGTVIDRSLTFAASSGNRRIRLVDEAEIRAHQAVDPQTGVPRYGAVRMKAPDAVNGHRWELLVYPTPTLAQNTAVVTFRYNYVPDLITNAAPYPAGGARYSEVIHAAVLAAAEGKIDDEFQGPAYQRFLQMLNSAIRADSQLKDEKGSM